MSDNLQKLLAPREVAEILGISVATLAVWRCVQMYDLPWVAVGRAIRYRREDVVAFVERRTQHPGPSAA